MPSEWLLVIWLSAGHAASVPTAIDVRDEAQCVALAEALRKTADKGLVVAAPYICVRRP